MKSEGNPFVDFYGQHNISPVRQPVLGDEDYNRHILRREKLYRTLGLPPFAFQQRRILEIGPGGGHNALAFFAWGAGVDFVEPNPKAREELALLMADKGISSDRWNLMPFLIEEIVCDRTYDVVIAEGFIPGIKNQDEVLRKIDSFISPGGVVVVTCVDDISFFCECLKRAVAAKLISSVDLFSDKVAILAQAFSNHLKKLQNATRPVEDWVTDMFLNPAIFAEWFSISDCLHKMGDRFHFLSSSPAIFTDYSWYKDIAFDKNSEVLQQFARKRHVLLLSDLPESIRSAEENEKLHQAAFRLRMFLSDFEQKKVWVEELIRQLSYIKTLSVDVDERVDEIVDETCALLADDLLSPEKVANATRLASAFGRGQQHVSLVKKMIYQRTQYVNSR